MDTAGRKVGEQHLHQANMSHDAALYGFRRKIFTIHIFFSIHWEFGWKRSRCERIVKIMCRALCCTSVGLGITHSLAPFGPWTPFEFGGGTSTTTDMFPVDIWLATMLIFRSVPFLAEPPKSLSPRGKSKVHNKLSSSILHARAHDNTSVYTCL